MQAWNQWSGQGSGTGSYPLAGFPPPVSAVPPPSVGTPGTAAVAGPVPPPIPGYPVTGYQWPNYTTSTIPSAVGAYPAAQWPGSQQHWEHWQQWQQQYNQWQQQYGDKFNAATSGAPPSDQPSQPSQAAQLPPASNTPSKRSLDGVGDSAHASLQEPKKMRVDTQSTDWASQKAASAKDSLEELSEAEKQFDEQFRNWEEQFNAWREQNANHPDTEQYKAYEAKWKSWREQLLQRREQMRKKREAKLAEALKEQQKHASQSISSAVSSHSTPTSAATNTTSSSTSQPSYPQTTVGMYGQVSFPGYPFNQQNYMFGMNPPTPAGPPTFPAAPAMFHGVPPPVLPPAMPPNDVPGGLSAKESSKANAGQQSENNDKEQHSEFLKTSSGNGIPGLDLLNQPGSQSKLPPGNDAPSMLLPPQVQLPIQTPADSKPFDFPPPNNAQNSNKYPNVMHSMNMPPPGFPNMPPAFASLSMSKANSYNQPPPQLSKDAKKEQNMSKLPSLMDGFDPNRGPPLGDRGLKDQSLDWPSSKGYSDGRSYGGGQYGDNFDKQSRFSFQGHNNDPINNYDRTNQYSKDSDIQSRQYFSDERRGNWQGGSPFRNMSMKENANNFGRFPSFGRDRDYLRDDVRHDPFPRISNDYGPDNEEADYERFHEYQQSAEHEGDRMQGSQGRGGRLEEQPMKLREDGQRGPRVSRFTDRDPFTDNPPEYYGNNYGSQNFPSRQDPMDGARDRFSSMNQENEYSGAETNRYGRWDYDANERSPKPDFPPLLEPVKIIDYRHQRADLGAPDIHEPATMFDYAHGAHVMPIGEEERFPHVPDSRMMHSQSDYTDRWGMDRERDRDRDRERGRPSMNYNRSASPNRHWGDNRDREFSYDSRTRWNSPGPRSRDERRWEGTGKEDYNKRDGRSRDEYRGRDDKGRDERRDDRWRGGDRSKSDVNHEERGRQNSRENEKKDSKGREKSSEDRDRRSQSNKTRSPSPKLSVKTSEEQKQVEVLVDDILNLPGRAIRAAKIVIILRGPPGSGKTFVAKLIKDKEVECGGSAPRILSLDDYFMTEIEKEEVENETGKKVMKKSMEYEYETAMEPSYRDSLTKAFKKTITDGYFPFIIVDCINNKLSHFEEMATFAKQKGFQIYICEMDMDLAVCTKRNVHKRTENEIQEILKGWDQTPSSYVTLDVRSLLQDAAIPEVNMEDTAEDNKDLTEEKMDTQEEESSTSEKKEELTNSSEPLEMDDKPPETDSMDLPKLDVRDPPSQIGFNFPRTTLRQPIRFQARRGFGGPIWRRGDSRRR